MLALYRLGFLPEPRVIFCLAHQAFANRVLADIFLLCGLALFGAENVVEGFVLPDLPGALGLLVDGVGRGSLDEFQDVR